MVVVSGWGMDAVLRRLLDEKEVAAVVAAAEALPEGLIKERVPVPALEGRAISVWVNRRNGARTIGVACLLGDGVRYASAHDRSYHVMGPSGPEGLKRVEFDTALSIEGAVPPRTVVDALVGRHATTLVDHPALRVDGLVATASFVNTKGGVPYGFSVALPVVRVAV